jgi:hypothetical protein
MLYREIIAVCSQIHTKLINTLCGQNVALLNVKLVVRDVTNKFFKFCLIDIFLSRKFLYFLSQTSWEV